MAAAKLMKARCVAEALGTAVSTLNSWLSEDELRAPAQRRFDFHRWRGNRRVWSEENFELLEMAIHRESQVGGVLAAGRSRQCKCEAPADPDAEAALAEVLGRKRTF